MPDVNRVVDNGLDVILVGVWLAILENMEDNKNVLLSPFHTRAFYPTCFAIFRNQDKKIAKVTRVKVILAMNSNQS